MVGLGLGLGLPFVRTGGGGSPPVEVTYDLLISDLAGLRSGSGVDANGVARSSLADAATAAGKGAGDTLVVAIAPGDYFPGEGEAQAWEVSASWATANGADVLVTGRFKSAAMRPVIDGVLWQSGMSNRVRFQWVWFCCRKWEPFDPAYAAGPNPAVSASMAANLNGAFRINGTTGKNPWFEDGVYVTGNYRGDHAHQFDPTDVLVSDDGGVKTYENRYPECAQMLPTIEGGGITGLTVSSTTYSGTVTHNAAFVGDNCDPSWIDPETGMIADGEHPVFIHPSTGGTGFEGYLTTVNGRIASTRVANPGSGYSTSGVIVQSWVWWSGKRTINAWAPSAGVRQYGGSGELREDCRFSGVQFHGGIFTAIRIGPTNSGKMSVFNCFFDRVYGDALMMPSNPGQEFAQYSIIGNLFSQAWSLNTDPQNPHSDNMQAFAQGSFSNPINYVVAGNVMLPGNARGGSASGWLTTDMLTGARGLSGYWLANYITTRQQANCMAMGYVGDAMFLNNDVLRWDVVGDLPYNEVIAQFRYEGVVGSTLIAKNVMELLSIGAGSANATTADNVITGQNGATIPYANIIAEPGARPMTRDAMRVARTVKPTYAGYGPDAGVFNWDGIAGLAAGDDPTALINWDSVPVFVQFPSVQGQDPGAPASTGWTRILGGSAAGEISINSGFAFQVADDHLGTNATPADTNYSGATRDKWIRLTCAAIGSGLTTRTASLVINGATFNWAVTSAGVLQFNRIDNAGVTYSTVSGITGQTTTADKIVIAFSFRMDAGVNSARLMSASNARALINFRSPGTLPEFNLGTSASVLSRRWQTTMTVGSWQLWVLLVDLSAPNPADKLKWMVNTELATLDPAFMAAGGASMNMNDFFASPWHLFASPTPIAVNGAFELGFVDWGQGTGYTLPDVSTDAARQALYNSFQRDLIGADGSGPLGYQPKVCFYGDIGASDGSEANSWNATGGLTNRGTLSCSAIKQAGNYTAA